MCVAKVMFLQASVILSTGGGCLPQCMLGYHTPGSRQPPGSRHPPRSRPPLGADPQEQTPPLRADTPRSRHPWEHGSRHSLEQTPPRADIPLGADIPPGADTPLEQTPPRADTPPPRADTPPRSRFGHTVNEQPVRILLECILVYIMFETNSQIVLVTLQTWRTKNPLSLSYIYIHVFDFLTW